eukprot:353213-Chlamydomonas_euryale.AAC.3
MECECSACEGRSGDAEGSLLIPVKPPVMRSSPPTNPFSILPRASSSCDGKRARAARNSNCGAGVCRWRVPASCGQTSWPAQAGCSSLNLTC